MGLLALLLSLPACGATGGDPVVGGDALRVGGPSSASRGDPAQDATRIEQLCRGRFGDRYAGLELEAGRIVVYRRPSPQLDAAVSALGTFTAVAFRDAPYAARELAALQQRVSRDGAYWRARGVVISSVAASQRGTGVEVGTAQVDRARSELPGRYGRTPPVLIVAAGPVVAATS